MHHIKISLSLAPSLCEQLDQLAQSLQVSRSHVLAQALAEYLERRHNRAMLAQINDAYPDGLDGAEQAVLRHAGLQHRRIAETE